MLVLLIVALTLLIAFAGQHLLISDELYFNALAEQMTYEQIQKVVAQNHTWSWVSYIILPIFNLLKFTLVASCLSLGYYFAANRWAFKPFFQVAVQAELVLLLPALVKLLWFLFVQTDYSLQDLQLFYPLSLLNLLDVHTVEPYLFYPLQLLNLFELTYWLVLAYGVAEVVGWSWQRGLGMVAASYGSGLLVWVMFVMFLIVSLS
ncbi:hypothetical protein EQG79_06935 [Spirosoma sordidisoli]|uniref:Yip1 domain-containing protein n=1 Tax=Spirosoma sordidisoli TaxID=2502893 RepID=A0A4Q2UQX9_9BACT|nr:hypothetical protein EQG79_06935 [Spirosoma sordidisoli]